MSSSSTAATPARPSHTHVEAHHHARRWPILGVLALAQLMVVLDATVVNIALPTAQHALHFSNGDRQWVVTAYALAFGSLLLLGGRLSDLIGRRRALIIGMIGFALASAVGGSATGFGMLVIARAAQGAFGALLAPAALASLTTTFTDPDERGKAFGIYGAVAGGGGGVGLLLGGLLTQYFSWRWCLYVNIPVAAVAVTGALSLMRNEAARRHVKLDVPGTLTGTAGLVAIVYGFSHANTASWTSPLTIALLGIGVVLLVVFVAVENRVAHPLLPMRVVLDRNRGGAYLAFAITGVGMFGVFLFLTYYLEGTLRYTPVMTGVAFLPIVATVLAGAVLATAIFTRLFSTRFTMSAGMTLTAIGMVLLTRIGVATSYASHVLPGLVITGFGIGTVFAPGMEASTSGIHGDDAGVASAMTNVTQQVGGSIGTALLNTIAAGAVTAFLIGKPATASLIAQAVVHSYRVAFWWAAGIFSVGAVTTALLLTGQSEPPPSLDDVSS